MGSLQDYKKRMAHLNRFVTGLASQDTISPTHLDAAQSELSSIWEEYGDSDLGEILYKIYEIQAYIYFFRGDLKNAQLCIEEAEGVRKRPYIESKLIREHIEQQVMLELMLTSQAFKKEAVRQILIGAGLFLAGAIVTGIVYNWAQEAAEREAIANGENEYSFHYTVMTGLILWGGVEFFRGLYNLTNYENRARELIRAKYS